jgi:hypothetical protein
MPAGGSITRKGRSGFKSIKHVARPFVPMHREMRTAASRAGAPPNQYRADIKERNSCPYGILAVALVQQQATIGLSL